MLYNDSWVSWIILTQLAAKPKPPQNTYTFGDWWVGAVL